MKSWDLEEDEINEFNDPIDDTDELRNGPKVLESKPKLQFNEKPSMGKSPRPMKQD